MEGVNKMISEYEFINFENLLHDTEKLLDDRLIFCFKCVGKRNSK